ncbi:MAG TPA: PLP-dependent aminotransferase family protein, partial [Gemmatimonadales bacterium]|nr:PLP-dependent aminotransferase family protein [Gemmatimonadales bacterium]
GTALRYGDPRGALELRTALARMLAARRALPAGIETLIVTRGSQMGLSLAAEALVRPGDRVAVEELGYGAAWDAFRRAGAELVAVPVDGAGLSVEALERALEAGPLRAVYLTPHHHYPTTAVLAAGRRLRLLELARRHRFAIVEDDYDHEFHYEGPPVLPLASADRSGSVIYVGTFSKVLTPGLRLGFVHASPPVIRALVSLRLVLDRQGDHASEIATAALIESGELQRAVRRARRVYRARRDALVHALRSELGEVLRFRPPAGGSSLWAWADGVDVDRWQERALAQAVAFAPARVFALGGRARPGLRLAFTSLSEADLSEAVRRMARALPPRRG